MHPEYLLDADYILAAMGLLSEIDPLLALRIMKKHLKPIGARDGGMENPAPARAEQTLTGCGV